MTEMMIVARQQAAEARELLQGPWGPNSAERHIGILADTVDALSARLAQAEQERDEANRWRDSWHDEARAAIATASQFEQERDGYLARLDEVNVERQRQEVRAIEAEARLRENEEALRQYVEAHHRELHIGAATEFELRVTLTTRQLARAALAGGTDG